MWGTNSLSRALQRPIRSALRGAESLNQQILGRLSGGENLSLEETASAVDGIMQGNWSEAEIGLFLTALRRRGNGR